MSTRLKITVAAIASVLLANALLSLAGVSYLQRVWIDEVQNRVRLDLHSARAAYEHRIDRIAQFLRGAAFERTLVAAAEAEDAGEARRCLAGMDRAGEMDFLALLDQEGRVLGRANAHAPQQGNLAHHPLVAEALTRGTPAQGTVVFREADLLAEGAHLAEQARLELVPTPAARPTADRVRTSGLMLAAAVPIRAGDGRTAGVLYGGKLVNRRNEIVDAIREEVFSAQAPGDLPGTVTIFLDDLRVATNVLHEDGSRAIGSRLSRQVFGEVIERGGVWAAPAFVVNQRYITAYEPIRDPTGAVIGALYVGVREAPFVHRRQVISAVFVGMVVVASLASFALLFTVTNWVLHPIGKIIGMAQRIAAGDLSARVEIRPPGEMGLLCEAIDRMADAVADRDRRLQHATQQQIGRSEQLAAVGRLAAGVAHEINNPLTGVLTFAHLLRERETLDDEARQDLDLIIHETSRAAEIVQGLLDFARERPAVKRPLDLNEVIRSTVRLFRNQKLFREIRVVEALDDAIPEIFADLNQLQQVLINLSLNAAAAMPEGGELTIRTQPQDGRAVMYVEDTGCGIRPEHLDRIFDPFFSTKPVGKGTGLGLSVSLGIVEQHGGTIEVASAIGRGSTFRITFPPYRAADSGDEPGRPAAPGNGAETPTYEQPPA